MPDLAKSVLVGLSAFLVGSSVSVAVACYFSKSFGSQKSVNKRETDEAAKARRRKRGKCAGLYNLGNTCYANALLQGMASCPSIVEWMNSLKALSSSTKALFLSELFRIIEKLNDPESEADSVEGLFCSLEKHGWLVPSHLEQDLFELLNVFVSTWDEEIAQFYTPRVQSFLEIKELEEVMEKERSESAWKLSALSKDLVQESLTRSPFSGLAGTQFQCRRCAVKHVRHDRFSALSLNIPKISGHPYITLQACLKKYFAIEVINNASCEQCDKFNRGKSALIKKQGISKFPPCLVFRIERRGVLPSGAVFKQSDHIDFPEILDAKDFAFYKNRMQEYAETASGVKGGKLEADHESKIMASLPGNPGAVGDLGLQNNAFISGGSFTWRSKHRYRLCAVSVHLGSADSGHFITYRRGIGKNNPRWFKISDLSVEEVYYEEVCKVEAYMLFYELINNNNILRSAK